MKTLTLLFAMVMFVRVSFSQWTGTVVEKYAGAIYVHSLNTEDRSTTKNISPRIGLNVRFPLLGYLNTRIVYDLPTKPFGHIIWEVPVVQHGWNGVSFISGYVPRLAALIKPSPLSIDGHNETSAMGSAPGATYALRIAASDSVSERVKTRTFAGMYRDTQGKLGFEGCAQLYLGEAKIGFSPFFDSREIGAATFFDSPDATGFLMVRLNKSWKANDVAGSFQVKGTWIGDPYVDVIYNPITAKFLSSEAGAFVNVQLLDEHKSQLGIAYNFTDKAVKGYAAFYW